MPILRSLYIYNQASTLKLCVNIDRLKRTDLLQAMRIVRERPE